MVTRDSAPEKYYPYKPGTVIKVEFRPETLEHDIQDGQHAASSSLPKSEILSFTIIKTLSRTLSCVLLVDLIPEKSISAANSHLISTSPHILKLCERRFSDAHREEYNASPWTPAIEAEYAVFKAIPESEKPHVSAENGDNSWEYDPGDTRGHPTDIENTSGAGVQRKKIDPVDWSTGHREAYLEKHCEKLYKQEVEVYRALAEVQGDLVPRLYGTVTVPRKNKQGRRRVRSRGMLIEYMRHSFSLRDIPEYIPDQERWQEIGNDAVRLVQEVGDMGVINKDVRLDNVLVVPILDKILATTKNHGITDLCAEVDQYRVVMIDFGLARLQADDESEDEFRKARISQDEEGAVGYILSKHLLKYAERSESFNGEAPFYYRPSGRLTRSWDDDEDDI